MKRGYQTPPCRKGHFLYGSTLDFLRDPIRTFMEGWKQHGDVVCFRLLGPLPFRTVGPAASFMFGAMEMYLVVHPDHIKHVLQENGQNYRKNPSHKAQLNEVAGDGLTMSEGDLWRNQRRLMQPAFHRSRIVGAVPCIAAATKSMFDRWEAYLVRDEPVDVYTEMLRLAADIVARTMFNADLRNDVEAVVRDSATVLEYAYRGMRSPIALPLWLPLPSTRRFVRARGALNAVASRLISERKRAPVETQDLLSLLLEEGMSEKLARDEIVTMILAGHDTTGAALTWALYLLSTHPDVARKLNCEVSNVLGGRTPTFEDIPKLRYTEMVLKEAMRLFPPAWVLSRESVRDDEVGGYRIPGGAMVFISPYITHRHPDFWRNPEEFDPERFGESSDPGSLSAYLPFGSGSRMCIGNFFALAIGQIVLAMIAQAYRTGLVPRQDIRPAPKLTLHPGGSVLMTLRREHSG
ncbi:MAG: cytochrome P450 [Blastocatellia bacterium]